MIRVFVCADTVDELAELEAIVRESDSLALVGSSLGFSQRNELVEQARPEVTLEQGVLDDPEQMHPAERPDAFVGRVLLVTEPEFSDALAAMRASELAIRGVLPAWSSRWEVRAAIAAVAEGLLVLHPDFADRSLAPPGSPSRYLDPLAQALSAREREILNLLAAGLANKQIAAQLHISEHTVKFHVTSIFNKLNASSRAEAVAIGARRGLILL